MTTSKTNRSTGRHGPRLPSSQTVVPVPWDMCIEMLRSCVREFQIAGMPVAAGVIEEPDSPPTLIIQFPGLDMTDLTGQVPMSDAGEEVTGEEMH